ncbi:MAG: hypothetical protein U0326_16325, partial [Polyangiales bacterium]
MADRDDALGMPKLLNEREGILDVGERVGVSVLANEDLTELPVREDDAFGVVESLPDWEHLALQKIACSLEVATRNLDIDDPPKNNSALTHIAEAIVDGKLLLPSDAQRLVELTARLEDVGDLAHRDRARTHIA